MDLIGKQLPSVSAADNGKFLGVDGGRWKAVDGGPSEPVNVTININSASGNDYIGTWSGATWNELLNAFMHNSARGFNPQTGVYFWFNETGTANNIPAVVWDTNVFLESSEGSHMKTYCKSDGTVRVVVR